MASCINKSHPKFKELLAQTNLKEDILAAKITNWRETTGRESEDDFPTKSQVLTYALKFNISEQLVEEAIEELEGFQKEGISKTVDNLFTVLSSNWNRLQQASLTDLRKLFNNPTIGNEFKFLLDRIKSIQEKTDEGSNFQQKVRAIALTIRELSATVSKIQDRVKDSDFKSLPPQESLQLLNKYMSFLNDWTEIIDQMQDDFKDSEQMSNMLGLLIGRIETTKKQITEPKKDSVLTMLVELLDPAMKRINDDYFKDIEKLEKSKAEAEAKGDDKAVKIIEKGIERRKEKYDKESINREVVEEIMDGKRGDAGFFNSVFETLTNSSDPILAAAKKKIKESYDYIKEKANTTDRKMQRELKPFLDALGSSRFNIYNFNRQFVQLVKRKDGETGEEYSTVSLMNQFTQEHEQDIADFQRKIDEALEKNDQEEVIKLRTEFAKWKNQYMNQEYTPEVYERYEVWERDEAGKKAKELRDEIFAKMNSLISKVKKGTTLSYTLSEEEEVEYQGYLDDLKRLSSLTDEYGNQKTGMDLKIAKAIQEYNKKTKDIYVWKERKGAFEAARKKQIEYLKSLKQTDPTIDEEKLLKEWDDNNTRTVISPDFYLDRKKILEVLNAISAKIKEKSDKEVAEEFTKTWDKIFAQLVGYRDKDGQPIGIEMTEEKIKTIKDLSEQLERLKKRIERISGLTEDETALLTRLENSRDFLSDKQEEQRKLLIDKREKLGLSKADQNTFYKAVEDLQNLQSKIPTDYYVATLNGFSSELGMDFDATTASKLLESPELDVFLRNDKFREWFEKNHIRVRRYNRAAKQSMEVWERVYVWNRIVPNDPKYYETTTLEDGTEIPGKPALKYYYRDVKDEFSELKELRELETPDRFQQERLKVLEQKEKNNTLVSYKTQRIVGKTVNNKGEFLPKDIDSLDKTKDNWDKYINYEYLRLKENAEKPEGQRDEQDYAKYQVIEIYKKYYLDYQEGLPYNERMWYTLPGKSISFYERVRSGQFKAIKKSIAEKLRLRDEVSQDEEEANVQQTEERKRIAKADLFGNVLTNIPMKFTRQMEEGEISFNIGKSIALYGFAAEYKKEFIKIEPFINGLADLLQKTQVYDLNTVQKKWNRIVDATTGLTRYQKKFEPVKITGESQRLKSVKSLQEQYFRGIYKTGVFGERGAVSDIVDAITGKLFGLFAFSSLSFSFSAGFTNFATGNFQLIFESVSSRNFNLQDYIKAVGEFHSKVLVDMMKDVKNELGERSFYGQLFDLYDPSQTFFMKVGEKYDRPGWLNASLYIKDMFVNPMEYGEFQIASTALLAVLRNTKIQTDNGETISVIDAYELDKNGDIKIKDGISFSEKERNDIRETVRQILRDTQGNYAKIDKTEIERNVMGSILYFMRKYFVPLLMNAWHTRRFNMYSGYGSGYNTEVINVIEYGIRGIIEYGRNMNYTDPKDFMLVIPKGFAVGVSTASSMQHRKLIQAFSVMTVSLLFSIIVSTWDDDDDRTKPSELRKWPYWKIVLFTQLIKQKSEVEQNTPLGGRNEAMKLLKNPLMIANKASQINDLIDYVFYEITNDKKARYQAKGGQKKKYEQLYGTDSKALITFFKIIGYQGGSIIPFTDMKKEKKAAAVKLENVSEIVEGK